MVTPLCFEALTFSKMNAVCKIYNGLMAHFLRN